MRDLRGARRIWPMCSVSMLNMLHMLSVLNKLTLLSWRTGRTRLTGLTLAHYSLRHWQLHRQLSGQLSIWQPSKRKSLTMYVPRLVCTLVSRIHAHLLLSWRLRKESYCRDELSRSTGNTDDRPSRKKKVQ